MIKSTFSVGGIATQYAAGYRYIEAGRASTKADASAQNGTFVSLGVVADLVATVESYDYIDTDGARGQWYVHRLKKADGSYSSWFTAQQGVHVGYLSVDEFKSYEMGDLNDFDGTALPDSKLERFIGMASRLADSYCSQHFGLEQVTERHRWRIESRRIYPRQTNVQGVVSLRIYVSAGQKADFTLSDLFLNSNENYVEVTSLSTVTYSLFPAVVALGLLEPTAEITYVHGFNPIPQDIKDATAFIAVELLGKDALTRQGMIGLDRLVMGESQLYAHIPLKHERAPYVPQAAAALLDPYIKISLR